MPHDPNEQFDHAVLDMIEHSPIGAVPNTPAYQDALNRLYAAHQAYADADHAGGHVTARSLSGRPSYHAARLESGTSDPSGQGDWEPNAAIFDRYLQGLPQGLRSRAEGFRVKVVGRPVHHRAKHVGAEKVPAAHDSFHTVFLVPGAGPHPGLPGNYLHGSIVETGAEGSAGRWAVHLHDRDDGAVLYEAPTMEEALAKLQELVESAPFNMNELGALGFRTL